MRCPVLVTLLMLALVLSGCSTGWQEIKAPGRSIGADGKVTIPVYESHSGWVWLEEHRLAKYSAYAGAGVTSVTLDLLILTLIALASVAPVTNL